MHCGQIRTAKLKWNCRQTEISGVQFNCLLNKNKSWMVAVHVTSCSKQHLEQLNSVNSLEGLVALIGPQKSVPPSIPSILRTYLDGECPCDEPLSDIWSSWTPWTGLGGWMPWGPKDQCPIPSTIEKGLLLNMFLDCYIT